MLFIFFHMLFFNLLLLQLLVFLLVCLCFFGLLFDLSGFLLNLYLLLFYFFFLLLFCLFFYLSGRFSLRVRLFLWIIRRFGSFFGSNARISCFFSISDFLYCLYFVYYRSFRIMNWRLLLTLFMTCALLLLGILLSFFFLTLVFIGFSFLLTTNIFSIAWVRFIWSCNWFWFDIFGIIRMINF